MRLQFRSPVTTKLHPHTAPVPPAGEFRVTQQFLSRDFYWNDGRTHNATDIGNFRCNDPIVAMAPGIARRTWDNATDFGAPNNALGVIIDHGYEVQTEYWHLNGWTIPDVPTAVVAGQQIGILGSTGLGQVCHTHIEAKRRGVKFDPEPLMFGGYVEVGDEDVKLPGKFVRHVQNRKGLLIADAKFRAGVTVGDDAELGVIPAGTVLYPVVVVEGRAAGTAADRTHWLGALAFMAGAFQLGFIHSSLWPRSADGQSVALQRIEEAPAADCSAQDAIIAKVKTAIPGLEGTNRSEAAAIAALKAAVQ